MDKETTLMFFEEKADFMTFKGGELGGFRDPILSIMMVSCFAEEVGYVTKEGHIIIGGDTINREPSKMSSHYVDFTLKQWDEIGEKARRFKRKCDIEALVAACEEITTLKQFPMVKDPPSESSLVFTEDGNGDVDISKDGYLIGVLRRTKEEFGKLLLVYPIMRTGLTEDNKAMIIAKCREIVESHMIE